MDSMRCHQALLDPRALLDERLISCCPSCRGGGRGRCSGRTACPSCGCGSRASARPRASPGGARRCGALAAAVRVVDRVHGRTARLRAHAHVALAAGLADRDVLVVGVADRRRRSRGTPRGPCASRRRAGAASPCRPPSPSAGSRRRRSGRAGRRGRAGARRCGPRVPTGISASGSALPTVMSDAVAGLHGHADAQAAAGARM